MKASSVRQDALFSERVLSSMFGIVLVFSACPAFAFSDGEVTTQHATENSTLPGVVVEKVKDESAPGRAGLRVGDVVLAWERSHVNLIEAETIPTEGRIESVFDWLWLEVEQAPRGPVKLIGERDGKLMALDVGVGLWGIKVRPRMLPAFEDIYLEGKELVEVSELDLGTAMWRDIADKAHGRGDSFLQCWLLLRIGQCWTKEKAWKMAHEAYKSALEAVRKPKAQVAVWDAAGKSYERSGDFTEAEGSYRSALEIYRATWGESLGSAFSLNKLGAVASSRGDLEQAADHFQRAHRITESLAPGSLHTARSLNNLGLVTSSRGDLEQAADHYRRTLEILNNLAPGSLMVARSLNNLGNVALSRGDLEQAAEHYQKALRIKEKLAPGSLMVASSLNNLWAVVWSRGDLELATEHHQRAFDITEKLAPGSLLMASSLSNLGIFARSRGDLEQAADHYRQALEITEKLAPGSLLVANILENLGNVSQSHGDLEQVADHYQRALEISEKLAPGSLQLATVLNASGAVARQRGDFDQAATYFDRSITALEAQVGKLGGSHQLQGQFRAENGMIYRDAIELHLKRDQTEEAFNILERYRARTFLAMLSEREINFSADATGDLDRSRRSLATRHDRVLHQMMGLSPSQDKDKIESITKELQDLRSQYEETMESIRRALPKLAALQDPKPLELQGIRDALDPGTVMLSYSVGEDRSDLFVVTRDGGLEVHPLPVLKLLKDDVERLRAQIQARTIQPNRLERLLDLSHRLYKTLIEPAKGKLESSERVLIVPDGPLHLLPFGALLQEPGTDPTTRGKFLVEWKPLHFALSGTVFVGLKSSRHLPAEADQHITVGAFGDPYYPQRFDNTSSSSIADVRIRSAVDRNLFSFQPLPHTRREVEQIIKLYPGATKIYLGRQATEDHAKSVGKEARILHFAAHGYTDDRDPLSSAVVLAIPEQLADDRDNGLLQAWEIFERLRLDADLVVLSACETGLGHEQGGDGLISLSRAFQYAGARTVAASLWQVSDRVTAELMLRFYRRLAAGQPKDAALRGAQLSLIRDPIKVTNSRGEPVMQDATAPYYWAAFQIYGDWQ